MDNDTEISQPNTSSNRFRGYRSKPVIKSSERVDATNKYRQPRFAKTKQAILKLKENASHEAQIEDPKESPFQGPAAQNTKTTDEMGLTQDKQNTFDKSKKPVTKKTRQQKYVPRTFLGKVQEVTRSMFGPNSSFSGVGNALKAVLEDKPIPDGEDQTKTLLKKSTQEHDQAIGDQQTGWGNDALGGSSYNPNNQGLYQFQGQQGDSSGTSGPIGGQNISAVLNRVLNQLSSINSTLMNIEGDTDAISRTILTNQTALNLQRANIKSKANFHPEEHNVPGLEKNNEEKHDEKQKEKEKDQGLVKDIAEAAGEAAEVAVVAKTATKILPAIAAAMAGPELVVLLGVAAAAIYATLEARKLWDNTFRTGNDDSQKLKDTRPPNAINVDEQLKKANAISIDEGDKTVHFQNGAEETLKKLSKSQLKEFKEGNKFDKESAERLDKLIESTPENQKDFDFPNESLGHINEVRNEQEQYQKDLATRNPELAKKVSKKVTFSGDVDAAIKEASSKHGVNEEYMRTMANIESTGNANPPSQPGHSAKGLYQFETGTAKQYGIEGKELDPKASADAAARLTLENKEALEKAGIEATPEMLYLAHQQGATGAIKVVRGAEKGLKYDDLDRGTRTRMAANSGEGKSAAEFIAMWKDRYKEKHDELIWDSKLAKAGEEESKTQTASLEKPEDQKTPILEATVKEPSPITEKPSEINDYAKMAAANLAANAVGGKQEQQAQPAPQNPGTPPMMKVRNDDPLILSLMYGNLRAVS